MNPKHHIESVNGCDAIQELIADYAFGLTSADETRLVEANLDACPEAVSQLADFRRIQDEMYAGVPQVEPPPQLSQKLMAAIAAPETATPLATPAVTLLPPRKMQWGWLTAAAAIVALVVTNVYWLARSAAPSPTPGNGESVSAQIPVQGESTFQLTSADNLRWVRLPPSQENTSASAVLMWNVESEIGLLYVRGFPELAVGKTFQLWLTRGDDRASAGTFRVDEDGNGALLFHLTDALDKYTWARITEEQGEGSNEPSDQVVVVGEL
jgi:anti-sigma-K factor RskA